MSRSGVLDLQILRLHAHKGLRRCLPSSPLGGDRKDGDGGKARGRRRRHQKKARRCLISTIIGFALAVCHPINRRPVYSDAPSFHSSSAYYNFVWFFWDLDHGQDYSIAPVGRHGPGGRGLRRRLRRLQ